jgi:hypothetical protein
MEYRVLLLQNGEFKKRLHKCKSNSTSKMNYKRILKENEEVIFPREYLTSDKISDVYYVACRVKRYEEKDRDRMIRDRLGRLVPATILWGEWTVLESEFYHIEETFYVFGHDPVSDRKDINFIIGLLLKGYNDKQLTKDIIVVHNKLIIYNQHQFDIVICKCKKDAIRLHDTLLDLSLENKFKRLIFMGLASDKMIGILYELMMEVTGWDYRKVSRTSTNT